MATKRSEDEKLDDAHLEHVIKMLEKPDEGVKPWTKKECCAYLCIAYNTTRLASLIEKYKDKQAQEALRRAEKRGKPATDGEISYTIQTYLEGGTIDAISRALYRGPTFIRGILDSFGVPIRSIPHSYFNPNIVPEQAIRDKFSVGDLVYSMRYDSLAKVISEYSPRVYHLYLLSEKQRQFAYQPAEELASLDHLKKYINV